MQRIREMLVQGYNYNSIIADIGLNERTFYRYLKRLFAADIQNLERASNEQMMRAVAVHVERANNIYRGLQAIASDTSVDAEARLEAYNHMFKLSEGLIGTYANTPAAAINIKRKLAAMEKGIPYTHNNPMTTRFLPPPAMFPEQQQQQQQHNYFDYARNLVTDQGDNNNDDSVKAPEEAYRFRSAAVEEEASRHGSVQGEGTAQKDDWWS